MTTRFYDFGTIALFMLIVGAFYSLPANDDAVIVELLEDPAIESLL